MAVTDCVKAEVAILVVGVVAEAAGTAEEEGAGAEGMAVRISPLAQAHHCQNQFQFPKVGKRPQL